MKKNILTIIGCIVLAISSNVLWGQTQVIKRLKLEDDNTITPMSKDALIQMDSNDKGMLLPRVALTDAKKPAPLTAHTAGMTVYNTATVSSTTTVEGVSPGYYYNNGTRWVRLTTEVEAEWKDGTVSGTNLIYAKQAKTAGNDVVVTDNGRIGIGTTEPKATLDIFSDARRILNFKHTKNLETEEALQQYMTFSDKNDKVYAYMGEISKFKRFGVVTHGENYNCLLGAARRYPAGDPAGFDGSSKSLSEVVTNGYGETKRILFRIVHDQGSPKSRSYITSIDSLGRMGIGTTEPKAKLDVNGKVRIADGSQQDGRVLTSDANGVGTWQALSMGNKTTKWILSGEQLFKKERVELQGNGSFEGADEIGLTISGNQVSLPAGKYIAFIDFDIAGVAEYGQFYLMNTVEKSMVFSTVYGEWLNGATILLRSSNAIKLKADFFATAGPKIQEPYYADPEPSGYTKKFSLKIIFLKLN